MPDSIQPNLLILDEVDSTNTYAREHFDDLPDGTLVVARRQTAGRGRRGRSWLSPPGINFTGSILLKRLEDGFHAGCLLGVAALSLLRELAPELPAYLKWPNDIYVEDRKLAGLLSESARIENGRVTAVVSGIGINVNLPSDALKAIDQPATSLLAETNREFNLDFFSKKLAERLIRYYIIYLNSAGFVIVTNDFLMRHANLLIYIVRNDHIYFRLIFYKSFDRIKDLQQCFLVYPVITVYNLKILSCRMLQSTVHCISVSTVRFRNCFYDRRIFFLISLCDFLSSVF